MVSKTDLAFYLKYRPQTLTDLIGQQQVVKTISAAFKNNKLAHAYLFVGSRGTGKTSLARILAKMVNCERLVANSLNPCNECPTCLSITDGSNLDLIEIDAASNRGIDDIRNLREKIKLAPTAASRKIYIIDEVHMLTQEAFNALLKTLEEPPAHALFILATTEVGKIPQTILSRVQRLDFKLAIPQEILQVLEKIVKQEKIDIDIEALKLLIRYAEGSFRDGVKLLDQISSLEGKITQEVVEQSLKSTQFEDLISIFENLVSGNTPLALREVAKQIEKGYDTKELILSMTNLLRDIMLMKNGLGEKLVQPQFTEDKYIELSKLEDRFTNKDLIHNLDVLQKAYEKLKFTSIPQLPLELAVVEMCGLEKKEPDSVGTEYQSIGVSERQKSSDELEKSDKIESVLTKSDSDLSDLSVIRHTDTPTSLTSLESSDSSDILKLKEKWTFVLETIRPYNFSLEALLRSVKISECSQTTIVLEVPYSFHQRILESPKNKDLLSAIFSDILGRSMQIAVSLGNRPPKQEDVINIEVAQDDEIIRIASEIFNSDSVN